MNKNDTDDGAEERGEKGGKGEPETTEQRRDRLLGGAAEALARLDEPKRGQLGLTR